MGREYVTIAFKAHKTNTIKLRRWLPLASPLLRRRIEERERERWRIISSKVYLLRLLNIKSFPILQIQTKAPPQLRLWFSKAPWSDLNHQNQHPMPQVSSIEFLIWIRFILEPYYALKITPLNLKIKTLVLLF